MKVESGTWGKLPRALCATFSNLLDLSHNLLQYTAAAAAAAAVSALGSWLTVAETMEATKKRTAEAVATTATIAATAGDDGTHVAPAKRAKESTPTISPEISPSPAPDFENEYDGHTLAEESSAIDRVNIADLTPQTFYRDYVAKRKPCLIIGCLPDDQWKVAKWRSFSYLKEKAGDMEISVEKRSGTKAKFGQGNEVKLRFGQFLDLLEAGSDEYYLTTQDVLTTADGRPHVMSPFMEKLADDFPLRPKLTGNLIPQNINVWMGRSKDGSSSGLHHDFHDNLYCVVSGRKKFDLFAPSEAENLYTRGKLRKIHRNGRINYVGEETNADGSHPQAEKALDASIRQDEAAKELEAAEAAVERGEEGAAERLERAEKALDEAIEAVIDAEEDGKDSGSDDGALFGTGDGKGDDGDDYGEDYDIIGDSDEEDADFWEAAKKKKLELQEKGNGAKAKGTKTGEASKQTNQQDISISSEDHDDDCTGFEEEGRVVDKTVKNPLNFSLVDTTLDEADLKAKYPKFASAKKATVEVSSGNMLYLPASWFHEVTSYGADEGNNHLAFNYWYHPPDGDVYDKPYANSFWSKDWALRKI